MTRIDHARHAHPATKAAREKCRHELARYPEPEREGSVFRQDDGSLWQRLVLAPDNVNRGDLIAGFDVVGTSTDARHDNFPAIRLDLTQGVRTGRLVVQHDTELMVYREFDPEKQDMTVDLDIESTDAAFVLREVFDLVSQTMVTPKMLTMAGPGGYPIVRFTGPKKDLVTVLQRYSPGGWEDLLLETQPVHETLEQITEVDDAVWYPQTFTSLIDLTEFLADCHEVGAPVRPLAVRTAQDGDPDEVTLEAKLTPEQAESFGFGTTGEPEPSRFAPWQRDRIEALLVDHAGRRWEPTRLLLTSEDSPRRTIFNQEVRDGWALRLPGGGDAVRYVGRELMAALVEEYPHLLDLPEGFKP